MGSRIFTTRIKCQDQQSTRCLKIFTAGLIYTRINSTKVSRQRCGKPTVNFIG